MNNSLKINVIVFNYSFLFFICLLIKDRRKASYIEYDNNDFKKY